MKHRSLLFCLSVLGLALVLAGCSRPEQPAAPAAPPEPAATETAPAAAPETITFEGKTYQLLDPSQPIPDGTVTTTFNGRTYKLVDTPAQAAKPASPQKPATPPAASAPAASSKPKQEPKPTPEPEPAPVAAPARATLASGTPIKVVTSSALSTKTEQVGDTFEAVLDENITDGDNVIARRGSVVKGVISASDPGGRVKGVATMALQLTSITLADGRQASVKTTDFSVAAGTSVKKDATKVGIGAGVGAVIGAIAGGGKGAAIGAGVGGAAGAGTALATRGDPAVVESETPITFNLTAPLTVTLREGANRGDDRPDRGGRRGERNR